MATTYSCCLHTLQSWQAGDKEKLNTYVIKELGLKFEVCKVLFISSYAAGL